MKKIYLRIAVIFVLICSGNFLRAQITYTTNGGSGLIWSSAGTWLAPGIPPNPCSNCIINIIGDIILDATSGTVVINSGSQLNIKANSTLEIDTYVRLLNTAVLVGSDATSFAALTVNDEVDMDASTTVRLANVSTFVNASNGGNNPVTGPIAPNPSVSGVAGIIIITNPGSFPALGTYDYLVGAAGYGDPTQAPPVPPGSTTGPFFYDPYSFNCDPNFPPVTSPNFCTTGLAYGPAISSFVGTDNLWEFISAPTLPVELVRFIASRNADQSISISWTSTQEINSAYFGVERSADANSWQTIGTVKAQGFSSITHDYSYVDAYPLNATNYYRLKMVDGDGKYKYSQVVAVASNGKTESLVVYNNPFTDQIRVKVNIKTADNLVLTVTDILGKTYFRQSYNAQGGDNYINIKPESVSPGLYLLHIRGDKYDRTVKLVKQ